MRLLKERAQFKPLHGPRRIFLIDHLDRANEQAANSLLKTLEEPPDHLLIIATVENMYDLLPTIRSRAIILNFSALPNSEMREFAKLHSLQDAGKRIALSGGSPGYALSLDIAAYERRRAAMHALLKTASGEAGFGAWMPHSEAIGRSKSEKLEFYLNMLYSLLRDLMILRESGGGHSQRRYPWRVDCPGKPGQHPLDHRGSEEGRRNRRPPSQKHPENHRARRHDRRTPKAFVPTYNLIVYRLHFRILLQRFILAEFPSDA